jgi:hypothetical protein
MKTRTGLVAGAVAFAVAFVPATAMGLGTGIEEPDEPPLLDVHQLLNETYHTLPPGVTDTIRSMGAGPCEFGVKTMKAQGFQAPPSKNFGFEYDPIDGPCGDLRDMVQHAAYQGTLPPPVEVCRSLEGKNCVALGHYACDFALLVGSGLVYVCLGGITPYN